MHRTLSVRGRGFRLALAVLVTLSVGASEAEASPAEVVRFPMEATFESPCTGELITFSGTVVFVVHQETTANGGNHLSVAQAWQDVSAVSASGTMYRFVNTSTGMQQNPAPHGGGPFTTTQTFLAISQSSLDNFVIQTTAHETVANGEVVVEFENVTTECRG